MVATAHWAVLDIKRTPTLTGVLIEVTTEVPCHLWMRWSLYLPQRHLVPRYLRGVLFREDLYLCLVAYHDNEQQEPGDTLVHTFLKEPWAFCETRYFYFHGTIAGVISPSTTACFSYHRLYPIVTSTFTPDKHPEITSVDGYVCAHRRGVSWADLHADPGTHSYDDTIIFYTRLDTWSSPDQWGLIFRGILLFDTSAIPLDAKILSATITLTKYWEFDNANWKPSLAIYASSPHSNTTLTPFDYQYLGSSPLSDILTWEQMQAPGPHIFTLNQSGRAHITRGGITKLGTREAKYDAPNIEPPFHAYAQVGWWIYAAEMPIPYRPTLTVTWQETE